MNKYDDKYIDVLIKVGEKYPFHSRRVKFVARSRNVISTCTSPSLQYSNTGQTARNYQFPVNETTYVLVFGNRVGRSGKCELHLMCVAQRRRTQEPAIVSSPIPISLPLDATGVKGRCQRQRQRVVLDRTEITAEESATSISSRSSFIHPRIAFLRQFAMGNRTVKQRLRFRPQKLNKGNSRRLLDLAD